MKPYTVSVPDKPCRYCGELFVRLDYHWMQDPDEHFEGCDGCYKKRLREREWEEICPPLYRVTDPARLDEQRLKKALAWDGKEGIGLLMSGKTGLGKTRIAYLALRQRFDDGRDCFAVSGVRFAQASADAFCDDEKARKRARRLLADCSEAEVLLFDDLGKERLTERVQTNLYAMLEVRTGHFRPTVFTTNLDQTELATSLAPSTADPIIRRIVEFAAVIAG